MIMGGDPNLSSQRVFTGRKKVPSNVTVNISFSWFCGMRSEV